jgi:DNA-binding transcriptional ArsR family regulator
VHTCTKKGTTVSFKNKRRSNFTQVSNTALYDPRLRNAEKGLLGIMLSFPPEWEYQVDDLAARSSDGRDAIYAQIKRLKESGYITMQRERREDGTLGKAVYEVTDEVDGVEELIKAHRDAIRTRSGKSRSGKTRSGKSDTSNTQVNNTQGSNSHEDESDSLEF